MELKDVLRQYLDGELGEDLQKELYAYIEARNQADVDFQSLLEDLKGAKEHFLETGEISDIVRPEVAESWKRCRQIGMEDSWEAADQFSDEEIDEAILKNAYFIKSAVPIMEESLSHAVDLKEVPLVMYITDACGMILALKCANAFTETVMDLLGMKVGARWTEESIGTNAVSLAIQYNKNFVTTAYEHFQMAHEFVNCISALIHDNDGNIIGTLTISYLRSYYNPMLTSFMFSVAAQIEKTMMMARDRGAMTYVMNNADYGILVLDSVGNILQANVKFCKMIHVSDPDVSTLQVTKLLKDLDWEKILSAGKLHTTIGETFLLYRDVCKRVQVDIYLVDLEGKKDGFVLILRDVVDIISLSQKYITKQSLFHFEDIVTGDPIMESIIEQCKQIADKDCAVLIEGESGTGKELLAESIHNYSSRAQGPFIAVNCAALPPSLVESELFGYEKGTFTDALNTGKAGKFEQANGGTIFLDEIGELSLDIQAKLLRVLDNQRITRIGGNTEKKLDIRVIAATNRDLYDMIQEKSFREDLYYRLCVFGVHLPSLNEREGDIPLLVDYFLGKLGLDNRGVRKKMAQESMDILEEHHWNGNIRELQNAVSRAYYLCDKTIITPDFLPKRVLEGRPESKPKLPDRLKQHEKDMILSALMNNNWNVTRAAKQLNISRATIYRKMKALGINQE
ncbi:MAG: sigma 54-interacting transcriptional regulator [Clostridia bacterium]|nr:sigma 54-interacting transcriptional regulator [Clostridia bacterium]MBR1705040.1 sigma 54-interacting transcriptional regulator [Clostridia bacterium]